MWGSLFLFLLVHHNFWCAPEYLSEEDAAAKEEWEWGIEMLEVSTMVLWGRGRENFGV